MTLNEIIALISTIIVGLGALSGLFIFLINRKINNSLLAATAEKAKAEVDQINLDMESTYAEQVKKWILDLKDIKQKYEQELEHCDLEYEKLKALYEVVQQELRDSKFYVNQCLRAKRRLFSDIHLPYVEWDADGKVSYVNGEWAKLFGLSYEEAMDGGWLQTITDDTKKEINLEWESKVIDELSGEIKFTILNPVTKKLINIRTVYTILFDIDGKPRKILGVSFEIV